MFSLPLFFYSPYLCLSPSSCFLFKRFLLQDSVFFLKYLKINDIKLSKDLVSMWYIDNCLVCFFSFYCQQKQSAKWLLFPQLSPHLSGDGGMRNYSVGNIQSFLCFLFASKGFWQPFPVLILPLRTCFSECIPQVPTKKLKKYEREYQTMRESQLQQEDPMDRYKVQETLQ